MKISRNKLIQKLVRKEYKAKRPTADQILGVIRKYDLMLHQSNGKRRSREVMTKSMAKALNSLE